MHNKEGTVLLTSGYCRINQDLVGNIYPLTRKGETMQKFEVFQYATALDINMVYYTMELSLQRKVVTTIVAKFGKFMC